MEENYIEKLNMPVIAAPLFLISGPKLVIECCKNGIVGTFPSLNQRSTEGFEEWVIQIKNELDEFEQKTGKKAAPFGVNIIVHPTNIRVQADLEVCVKHKVPLVRRRVCKSQYQAVSERSEFTSPLQTEHADS